MGDDMFFAIDLFPQGVKTFEGMTEYEAANSLVIDDNDAWVVAGENLFNIKEFRSICNKCDHSYDCNMRSVLTAQCNFFSIMNRKEGDATDRPYIMELTEREYRHLQAYRELRELEEKRKQWRKEHGLPETPKPTYNDDFGTPACTEDGEYLVGCEPDDYYDKKEKK